MDSARNVSSGRLRLDDAARGEILTNYERLLRRANSPILGIEAARATLFAQAESILDDLVHGVAAPASAPNGGGPHNGGPRSADPHSADPRSADPRNGDPHKRTVDLGTSRAAQGVHPSASLEAATLLFDAALPVLSRVLDAPSGDDTVRLSLALHRAIMERITLAAIPYVNYLLKNLRASHLNERQRVSRELHDRAAHGIGVGLRHLELFRIYSDDQHNDAERAAAKLAAAEDAFHEALNLVRSLSAELRQTVGNVTLEEAIRAYLRSNVPVTVRHTFTAVGDSGLVPTDIGDELYLIARESIHNALRHAEMSALRAHLEVADASITFSMTDNGHGFDAESVLASPRGSGLLSMRERAALLGGMLTVRSTTGHGATITVIVPIALR